MFSGNFSSFCAEVAAGGITRMFPLMHWQACWANVGEQDGFEVLRVVIHDGVEKDQTERAVAGDFDCDSPIKGAITWNRRAASRTLDGQRWRWDLTCGGSSLAGAYQARSVRTAPSIRSPRAPGATHGVSTHCGDRVVSGCLCAHTAAAIESAPSAMPAPPT